MNLCYLRMVPPRASSSTIPFIIYLLSTQSINPTSKLRDARTISHNPRICMSPPGHDSRQLHVRRPPPISPHCNLPRHTRLSESHSLGLHDGQLHRMGHVWLSNSQFIFIIGKCTRIDIKCVVEYGCGEITIL